MTTRPATIAQAIAVLNYGNALRLRDELEELQPGQPRAQAYDTDRTTSGQGPADPTHTAACTPSRPKADLDRLDHLTDQLYRTALAIAAMSENYLPRHEPKRGTIQADTRGCELHQRAGITAHHPARVTTDFASVLTSPLREPVPVCHACQDYVRRAGALPTNEQIIRHERTGKWSQRTNGKRASVFSAQDIADEWAGKTA